MKKNFKYLLIAAFFAAATVQLRAGAVNDKGSADSTVLADNVKPGFDFFSSDDMLEMTLKFNMKEFIKTRFEMDQSYDATLSVNASDNMTLTQDIKLRARGKMRRKYCSFPPIMLKIKNVKDSEQVFRKGNIKLVTHCSQAANFDNYLLKEYLAYKLYNLITPYSFRTRLVTVHYVDSVNNKRSFTEYGILIENDEDLAERNHAIVIENPNIGQNHMDDHEMARVALFNYMIGNTDWSVKEQHNLKVLKIDIPTAQKGIPVSYDFDYSGFVNTVYSSPNDQIPITNVTDRYFQGSCYSDDLYRPILDQFEELEPKFLQTIEEFEYLSKTQKKLAESYINGFFRKVRKENSLLAEINRTCLR